MASNSSYQQILVNISELCVWASPFINIGDVENMSCVEFDFYRNTFQEKHESDMEQKSKLIEAAFKAAKSYTETICKTIGSVFGGKKSKGK